ncbi:hypothetical protein [Streptomyces sp. IBSBF 2390]|uniref:hypothetical protein n=1 Tax=Streptomyces sp. IBSBF 2390 TaxID=2903533 RepID=UPI003FA71E03
MNGNQIEGLIGMTATLGILLLLVLPSVLGIVRDRRIDRQLREAERNGLRPAAASSQPPAPRRVTKSRRHHGATRAA